MGYEPTGERAKQKRKPLTHRLNSQPLKRKYTGKVLASPSEPHPECSMSVTQCSECEDYKNQIKILQKELCHWQSLYYQTQQKPLGLHVLRNDSKVQSYTGLPSRKVFCIFSSFGDKVKKIRPWRGPGLAVPHKKVSHGRKKVHQPFSSAKEEYFITLFHMKTMLKGDIIGDLFGISASSVSQICATWWKFMAKELKPLVYNPSPQAHRALLPALFNKTQYCKVEHIVDCTEVFTETPKSKNVQAVLWSNYKHHHTCKFLVSITATCLINFISKGYGSRASDQQIVEHSGFLDEVWEGEQVMADKGFNISDLVT